MIVCETEKCTGCMACMNICPLGAISPSLSSTYKTVPQVNTELCKGCGKCQSICPVNNPLDYNTPYKCYAATKSETADTKNCATAGVSAALGEYIVSRGGIVFGAGYKNGKVCHMGAENKEQLELLDLGLETRLSTKVGLLSGGQRQAVTLLMATLNRPKLLLLDEHTAALDPKTAEKVLQITDKIVTENKLTTLMITHNMRDAIEHGNRLIMMHEGNVIIDVEGEEKKKLTVEDLLALFTKASGKEFANDRAILS